MAKGVLYVMTTVVKGLVKIGKTGTGNFENRMRELENNGYANVTGLKRFFAIEVEDYGEKETLLHTIFSKSQVKDKELFALDESLVVQLLSSFDGNVVFSREGSKEDTFDAVTDELKHEERRKQTSLLKKSKGAQKSKSKKSPFRFSMIGVEQGEFVAYLYDDNIKAKVLDDSHVEYAGRSWSLSGLAKHLLGTDAPQQGPVKFTYKGKLLDELRKEKERERLILSKLKRTPSGRRTGFRFSMAGVPLGATVRYVHDPDVEAKVVDDSHVEYKGRRSSLSRLAMRLAGTKTLVQGPVKFTYNGKLLDDLRKENEKGQNG